MANTGPKARFLKIIHRKQPKSGKKHEKAIAWYFDIKKKAQNPRMAKWAERTLPMCEKRIKLYGISQAQLARYAATKGYSDLLSK